MIAATTQMNKKICAQIKGIESVRSPSSGVITQNVFQLAGSVIMTMIVEMDRMNVNAPIILALLKDSNAKVDTASKKNLNVMVTVIAWIFQMKWIVLLGIQMESIARKISLNVITTFV